MPILPILGPSGAGKSSFVRAGVIPRLRERTGWLVLDVTPGTTPYPTLATALTTLESAPNRSKSTISSPSGEAWDAWDDQDRADDEEPPRISAVADELATALSSSRGLLGQRLRQLADHEDAQVLLFVDQLEEISTLSGNEQARLDFMEMLCSAADDPRDPVRLIFTLRDDFLGKLAEGERAREALSRVTVLRTPGPTALEEILVRPLAALGYRFSPPTLSKRMVEAVTGEAASLPLLQFAARQLWERRDVENRLLTQETYESIGGVEGALAEHADGVLEGMTPAQVDVTRQLLLRLITPDGTRRVMAREEIVAGLGPEGDDVLGRLIQARLVSVRRSLASSQESSAELQLAHESLIRGWERLSRWFDADHEDLAFLTQVSQAAELWEERGRRAEEVWQGEALRDALRDARRLHELPPLVRDFLDVGQKRERRQQRRRRGLLAGGVGLLALIALVSTVGVVELARKEEEAQRERAQAEAQRQHAQAQSAEALCEGARAAFLRGDLVQARAMLRASLQTAISTSGRALWWRLARDPLIWQRALGGDVDALDVSPDGSAVAAVGDAPAVFLFRVDDMSPRTLRGHRHKPDDVAFSPDGRTLASTSSSGTLRLWDLERESSDPVVELADSGGPLAFSAEGDLLVTGHRDGRARLWTLPPHAARAPTILSPPNPETTSPIAAVAIDRSGRRGAAATMDGRVRLWDTRSGELVTTLRGSDAPALSVSFHPDGALLAVGSSDASLRVWRLSTPDQPELELRHADAVRAVAYSPDGARLAAGTARGEVTLWSAGDGREIGRFTHGPGQVLTLAFGPRGEHLATGGTDQNLRLFQLARALADEPDRGHTAAVIGVDFAPDGQTLATGGNDQTIRLWDTDTGAQRRVLSGRTPSRTTGVDFSPEGDLLVAAGTDGHLRIWDAETGGQHQSPVGPATYITAARFHPNGEVVATASFDGAVRLWDPRAPELQRVLHRHDAWATDVAFSPAGDLVASCSHDRSLRLWDLEADRERAALTDLPAEVNGLAFTPDGATIAFTMGELPAQLWTPSTGERRPIGPGQSRAYWLGIDPTRPRLGLPRADGTAMILPLDGDDPLTLRGHHGEVNYLRFSPDGHLAATTSDDGTVRLWDSDTGRPRWWAPALLSRSPRLASHQGWRTLEEGEAESPSTAWREAVGHRARRAVEASDHGLGCLLTFEDQLELWDLDRDRRLRAEALADLEQILITDRGCVSLANGQVRLQGRQETRTLARSTVAVARGDDETLLIAVGREIEMVSIDDGEVRRRLPAGAWVEAMLMLEDQVVIGFGDGGLEVMALDNAPEMSVAFDGTPASPPVALAAGPSGTVAAGYRSGDVGLWSLESGALLYRFRLHGPAIHLQVDEDHLYAASELGDARTLDLGILGLDECALLRHLWSRVPVIWHEGAAQRRPPPEDHRCVEADHPAR